MANLNKSVAIRIIIIKEVQLRGGNFFSKGGNSY